MRPRNSLPMSLLFSVLLSIESPSLFGILHFSRLSPRHSSTFVSAALTNKTVDDGDPLILYSPLNSWHANGCSACLQLSSSLPFNGTWHDGTHIIPTTDADDLNSSQDSDDGSSTTSPQPPAPSTTSPPVAAVSPPAQEKNGDGDDGGKGDDDDHGGKGKGKDGDSGNDGGDSDDKGNGKRALSSRSRRSSRLRTREDADDAGGNPFFVPKLDSDDEGFVDTPVFAQFNFTGSAVYVYALVPQYLFAANNTPTFVNLTCTLDSQPDQKFTHKGSSSVSNSSTSYDSSVLVFSASGLPESSHSLTMHVGPDSVFLLDKIIYTQDDNFGNGGNDTQNDVSTPLPGPSQSLGAGLPSESSHATTASAKSHNIATFAGAVGGSVGLLSLLAISLAFSIYRRRARARQRDQRIRAARRGGDAASFTDSFHTEASEDGPPMQGPAPFVPRYFPGTVPAAPPAYTPSASSSSNHMTEVTTSLLSPVTSPHAPLPTRPIDSDSASYAERPPPTPPPPGDDGYFAPPPTFQIAITTPVPAILARFSNLTSSQASQASRAASAAGHSSFRLPFSFPSRRPSDSSLAARSAHRSSPHHTPQLSRTNSTRSSLRRASVSTQPLLSQVITGDSPDSRPPSRQGRLPSRPPSSASESPPSIAPPAEVLEAEREREAEELRTRYTGDLAV